MRETRLRVWRTARAEADPTPWMSGGELLLTTGMQLGTPKKQREFVARLAGHRASR